MCISEKARTMSDSDTNSLSEFSITETSESNPPQAVLTLRHNIKLFAMFIISLISLPYVLVIGLGGCFVAAFIGCIRLIRYLTFLLNMFLVLLLMVFCGFLGALQPKDWVDSLKKEHHSDTNSKNKNKTDAI